MMDLNRGVVNATMDLGFGISETRWLRLRGVPARSGTAETKAAQGWFKNNAGRPVAIEVLRCGDDYSAIVMALEGPMKGMSLNDSIELARAAA
jgi:hypothetical protein